MVTQHVLLVPLFLSKWGVDYYGEWIVLSAVPTMLSVSNLGIGTSSSIEIIHCLTNKNEEKANAVLATSMLVILGQAILLLVAALMLVLFLPGSVGALSQKINDRTSIFVLLTLSHLAMMFTHPLEGFWIARERAAFKTWFFALLSLIEVLLAAMLLLQNSNAFYLVLGTTITRFIGVGMFIWRSSYLVTRLFPIRPNFSLLPSLVGQGLGFQLQPVWWTIFYQFSLLIAQWNLGAAGAATWGTLRSMSRVGNQVMILINHSVLPELQTSIARNDLEASRRLHSIAIKMSFVVSVLITIALIIGGGWLYRIWTRGELYVDFWVWPLLGMGLVFHSVWFSSSYVHVSKNQPWFLNLWALAASIIAIFIMHLLGQRFDMVGFATGSLVFDAILSLVVLRKSLSLLNDRLLPFMRRV